MTARELRTSIGGVARPVDPDKAEWRRLPAGLWSAVEAAAEADDGDASEVQVAAPAAPPGPLDLTAAAQALARGDARAALRHTEREAEGETSTRLRAAMRGRALEQVGRYAEAVELFDALRASKGWERVVVPEFVEAAHGRALAGLARKAEDRAQAQALRERASTLLAKGMGRARNPEAASMRVERARVLAEMLGENDRRVMWEAKRALRSLDGVLRDYPNHPDYAQLRLVRARTLIRAKKYAAAADAFRDVAVEHAGRPEADLAWREWEALAQAEPRKVDPPAWTTRMKLDAAAFARRDRFVEHSRSILDELLEDPELAENYRREALRSRAETARRQRDWDRCIADLTPQWERSGNFELRDDLSRCLERGERYDTLLDLWLDGVAKRPRPQRESALYKAAEIAFRAGRYARARELLERYEKSFRGHATDRNFMRAMIAEHLGEVGEALDEFERLGRRSKSSREMARYYRGKLLLGSEHPDQRAEGEALLRELVARGWESMTTSGIYGGFPLYYGLQARARLVEAGEKVDPPPQLKPEARPGDLGDWGATQARLDAAVGRWGEASVALERAAKLHRVGELERARRELRIAIDEFRYVAGNGRGGRLRGPNSEELEAGLGWRASWRDPRLKPSRQLRKVLRDRGDAEEMEAELRELAMALEDPYRVARLSDYALPYRVRYFLKAYEPQVTAVAEARGIDPTHMWALMYTESRFRRHVVSYVGARGALQIMPWTGRQLLARLGEYDGHFDPDTLFDIDTNTRLAGYYVAELLDNFRGQPAFAYGSYNGGPSNIARWLEAKAAADVPNPVGLDDYIEEIPFTETSRYVRRVLETQAAYSWIYRGELPTWSDVIDARVKHSIEF